ncbi:MAG TPA: SGNH/GDSL hydrolase family protein [Candidatus Limnocylindrales bacterium]|nr:SGNH/GDSL hydrolase family protein [Candidatus Limnocylindrales bacterium]
MRGRRGPALPLLVLVAVIFGAFSIGTAIAIGPSGDSPGSAASRSAGDVTTARPTSEPEAAPATPRPGGASAPITGAGTALVRPEFACAAPAAPTAPPRGPHPGAGLRTEPSAARHPRHLAVFLGDSYTSGYRGVGEGANGWPARVGSSFGWQVRNLAVPGIGFVNPGWTGQPIRTLVDDAIAARPSIVVVAGGHNDLKYGTARVADAADAVLDRLRGALPNALLVVVGPIWHEADVPDTILALRNHLRTKAGRIGALFIDPIAGGWFTGANRQYIGADGVHPTNAGHRHIATKVLTILRSDARFAATQTRIPAIEPIIAPTPVPVPTPTPWVLVTRAGSTAECPG